MSTVTKLSHCFFYYESLFNNCKPQEVPELYCKDFYAIVSFMSFRNKKVFGYLLAASCVFFWGITFVCTKYLLRDFTPLEILFYRFIAAYIGLWILRPRFEKIAMRDNILFALAGFTGVILYQLFENIAINYTNASNVSVIVCICPLFTAIFAQIFFKEKHLSLWFIVGFVISITGVTLVCLNGNRTLEFNPKGDFLALSSAICWGLYSTVISIINRKNYDQICSTRRIFFFAVLMMIPLMIFGNHNDIIKGTIRFTNIGNLLCTLFLGLIASGFCFAAWNKACKTVGTVKVSCGLYLIPVVTIIFAFFALGEKISLLGGLGAAITIAGLFVSEK